MTDMALKEVVQKGFVGRGRSIGVASRESGVAVSTLRAWDHLVQPHRVPNGAFSQRLYDDMAMERIARVLFTRGLTRRHGITFEVVNRFDTPDGGESTAQTLRVRLRAQKS